MKVALIGYGYWGPNIARNLNRSKKADLYAICDIDEKNLNKARKLYGDDVKYVKETLRTRASSQRWSLCTERKARNGW